MSKAPRVNAARKVDPERPVRKETREPRETQALKEPRVREVLRANRECKETPAIWVTRALKDSEDPRANPVKPASPAAAEAT